MYIGLSRKLLSSAVRFCGLLDVRFLFLLGLELRSVPSWLEAEDKGGIEGNADDSSYSVRDSPLLLADGVTIPVACFFVGRGVVSFMVLALRLVLRVEFLASLQESSHCWICSFLMAT